ncbi:hypothetical protein HanPSC8_Chr10g0431431 [Helianthus annuus]|nr:hypothetical protein HanPSC8_Chr10g0431431 [Helianthus annuus]
MATRSLSIGFKISIPVEPIIGEIDLLEGRLEEEPARNYSGKRIITEFDNFQLSQLVK